MAIYFASDVHLGLNFDTPHKSYKAEQTERRFVEWLRAIEADCEELFLVGDLFDFWHEWRRVIPKGFVRTLGQLASMADRGVKIHIFEGNHDMWMSGYLVKELGVEVYNAPRIFELQDKKLFIGHGDTLGERPWINRALNKTFRSRATRWIFANLIHPNASMRFGHWWSRSGRGKRGEMYHQFMGEEEYLIKFAREEKERYDYFIFGHLHTPMIYPLDERSKVVILGEWIANPTYARMENGVIELIKWEGYTHSADNAGE